MKVLQVNCVYKKGSTGKIVHDIHTELKASGIESVVCYGRGVKIKEPGVYKTCGEFYSKFNNLLSRITGIMYGGCFFSTNKLIRIIKKEKPDVVHLHCLNGYFVNIYRLVSWLKKRGIKTVLTLHAEFMHTANCGHAYGCEKWKTGCGKCPVFKKETKSILFDRTATSWRRMKKAFDGFENISIVAVSKWIAGRASSSPILKGKKVEVIYNGILTENFNSEINFILNNELKKRYGITENKKIVLHVTPSFDNKIKGGKYFIELSKILPKEYQCVVIGSKNVALDNNIISIPFISNQLELAEFYKMAEVFVITSLQDNYPTVCLEANCCGTPVVGFDVGGVKETIFNDMGDVVPFGDIDALSRVVQKFANEKMLFSNQFIDECRKRNDKKRMSFEYVELYKRGYKINK